MLKKLINRIFGRRVVVIPENMKFVKSSVWIDPHHEGILEHKFVFAKTKDGMSKPFTEKNPPIVT